MANKERCRDRFVTKKNMYNKLWSLMFSDRAVQGSTRVWGQRSPWPLSRSSSHPAWAGWVWPRPLGKVSPGHWRAGGRLATLSEQHRAIQGIRAGCHLENSWAPDTGVTPSHVTSEMCNVMSMIRFRHARHNDELMHGCSGKFACHKKLTHKLQCNVLWFTDSVAYEDWECL